MAWQVADAGGEVEVGQALLRSSMLAQHTDLGCMKRSPSHLGSDAFPGVEKISTRRGLGDKVGEVAGQGKLGQRIDALRCCGALISAWILCRWLLVGDVP